MATESLTAERILVAAEEVLRRYGPAKATVVDVARALGVSHGSVYRHVPSKAALRDAVTERWLERVSASLAEIAGAQAEPPKRLARWLDGLVQAKRRRRSTTPSCSPPPSSLRPGGATSSAPMWRRSSASLRGSSRTAPPRATSQRATPGRLRRQSSTPRAASTIPRTPRSGAIPASTTPTRASAPSSSAVSATRPPARRALPRRAEPTRRPSCVRPALVPRERWMRHLSHEAGPHPPARRRDAHVNACHSWRGCACPLPQAGVARMSPARREWARGGSTAPRCVRRQPAVRRLLRARARPGPGSLRQTHERRAR